MVALGYAARPPPMMKLFVNDGLGELPLRIECVSPELGTRARLCNAKGAFQERIVLWNMRKL